MPLALFVCPAHLWLYHRLAERLCFQLSLSLASHCRCSSPPQPKTSGEGARTTWLRPCQPTQGSREVPNAALGHGPNAMGKCIGPSATAWLCRPLPGCRREQPWVMCHGVRGTLHRQGHRLQGQTPPPHFPRSRNREVTSRERKTMFKNELTMLPREVGDAPSLETFKVRLDGALSNLI